MLSTQILLGSGYPSVLHSSRPLARSECTQYTGRSAYQQGVSTQAYQCCACALIVLLKSAGQAVGSLHSFAWVRSSSRTWCDYCQPMHEAPSDCARRCHALPGISTRWYVLTSLPVTDSLTSPHGVDHTPASLILAANHNLARVFGLHAPASLLVVPDQVVSGRCAGCGDCEYGLSVTRTCLIAGG
jgi:hypothetical protein